MTTDTNDIQQIEFFRTFGYLHLQGYFAEIESKRLGDEVLAALVDSYGDKVGRARDEVHGKLGYYLPMVGPLTPISRSLVKNAKLVGIVEMLLGDTVVPKPAKGVWYNDFSPWHRDFDVPNLRAVKCVTYFGRFRSTTGALRVVPGSHLEQLQVAIAEFNKNRHFGIEKLERDKLPAVALDLRPGDLLIFDVHLWHASFGGRSRLQWTVGFAAYDRDDDDIAGRLKVYEYIRSFLAEHHEYDQTKYPYFDDEWVSHAQFGDNVRAIAGCYAASEPGQNC